MKTKLKIFVLLSVLLIVTMACSLSRVVPGAEKPKSTERDTTQVNEKQKLDAFNEIDFKGGGTIYLEQADDFSIEIEGSKSAVDTVKIEVRNGRLIIDQDRSGWLWLTDFDYPSFTIRFKDLTHFKLVGGAKVVANNLELESLMLEISGGGSLSMADFYAQSIVMDIEGGLSLDISGEASQQDLKFAGGIDYKAEDFKGENVKLKMDGAGSAVLWATESLDLNLSGAYNLQYFGKPILSQNVQGVGNLEAMGDK